MASRLVPWITCSIAKLALYIDETQETALQDWSSAPFDFMGSDLASGSTTIFWCGTQRTIDLVSWRSRTIIANSSELLLSCLPWRVFLQDAIIQAFRVRDRTLILPLRKMDVALHHQHVRAEAVSPLSQLHVVVDRISHHHLEPAGLRDAL